MRASLADGTERSSRGDMGGNHGVEVKIADMGIEDAQEVINHMIDQAQVGHWGEVEP